MQNFSSKLLLKGRISNAIYCKPLLFNIFSLASGSEEIKNEMPKLPG